MRGWTKRMACLWMLLACFVVPGKGEDSVPQTKDGFLRRYWRTIAQGQVDRTHERTIDVTVVPMPTFTREGSFGLGAIATGLYRVDRTDSVMPPSDVSLVGNASLRGFFAVSAKGNHYFTDQHSRLSYNLLAQRRVLNFWGISYDACSANPASAYTRRQLRANADYVYAVWPGMKLSASLYVNYTDATRMGDPAYLEGQRPAYFLAGAGLAVEYDTRDFIPQPTRGVYVSVRTIAYPGWAGNFGRTVVNTTAIADAYVSPWRGGVLAADLYGKFNTRNAPWTLREELGFGGYRMRGYYAGRYIDNNLMAAQVELRQHVWWRLGLAAWAGAGVTFPRFDALQGSDVLPTWGVGLRFEFKHRVNLRVDYGFGRDTRGIVFQMSEAF